MALAIALGACGQQDEVKTVAPAALRSPPTSTTTTVVASTSTSTTTTTTSTTAAPTTTTATRAPVIRLTHPSEIRYQAGPVFTEMIGRTLTPDQWDVFVAHYHDLERAGNPPSVPAAAASWARVNLDQETAEYGYLKGYNQFMDIIDGDRTTTTDDRYP